MCPSGIPGGEREGIKGASHSSSLTVLQPLPRGLTLCFLTVYLNLLGTNQQIEIKPSCLHTKGWLSSQIIWLCNGAFNGATPICTHWTPPFLFAAWPWNQLQQELLQRENKMGLIYFFWSQTWWIQGSSHGFERWKALSCRDRLGK